MPGWRLVALRTVTGSPLPSYTVDLNQAVTTPVDILVNVPEYTVGFRFVYFWDRYVRERPAVVHPILIVPADRHDPRKGHWSVLYPRISFGGMYVESGDRTGPRAGDTPTAEPQHAEVPPPLRRGEPARPGELPAQ